jgi:pimeloyl-ACP methyl ester carboxylesterase
MKYLISLFFLLAFMAASAQDAFDSLIYPFAVNKVDISAELSIAYIDEGQGEQTLLFVHGLGGYLKHWSKNIPELAKGFRCIAIDLPGYGKSSKGSFDASMSFQAEMILAFMEKLQLQKVWLVGHSMGGQISLTLALKDPSKLAGLILLAPAGIETFTEEQKQFFLNNYAPQNITDASPEQIRANYALNFYQIPNDAEQLISDRLAIIHSPNFNAHAYSVASGVWGMVNEPVFDQLHQISLPCLVVFATNDALIPNRFMNPKLNTALLAEKFQKEMPQAKIELIENTGHMLQYESPKVVNSILKNFILER